MNYISSQKLKELTESGKLESFLDSKSSNSKTFELIDMENINIVVKNGTTEKLSIIKLDVKEIKITIQYSIETKLNYVTIFLNDKYGISLNLDVDSKCLPILGEFTFDEYVELFNKDREELFFKIVDWLRTNVVTEQSCGRTVTTNFADEEFIESFFINKKFTITNDTFKNKHIWIYSK